MNGSTDNRVIVNYIGETLTLTPAARSSEGIRKPDLAVRLGNEPWKFIEVKANTSRIIKSQILKDRAIETGGYFWLTGPKGTGGPRAPTYTGLTRVQIVR